MEYIFDYCIIGSGIGGGILLNQLLEKEPNANIVVIEAGGLKHQRKPLYLSNGLPFRMITTSVQLGGTSNLWHGVLGKLDPIDFEKRDWIPESGWPITLDELEPYYNKAAKFYSVCQTEYFDEENLPESLLNELAKLRWNKSLLKNKLFQQPLKVKNFKYEILHLVKKFSNLKILQQTSALELISEDDRIVGCKIGNQNGSIDIVYAKTFIVCAGALETPRLLLNSKGISNQNVGKYLMDHPMGNLVQIRFKKPKKAPIYSDMRYGNGTKIKTGLVFTDDVQRKYKLPNHNFYIRPSFIRGINDESEKVKLSLLSYKSGNISFRDVWRVLMHLNVVKQILTYKLSLNITYKYADLFFLTEQVPSKDSFVTLSKVKDQYGYPIAEVNWALCEYDLKNMRKVYDLCLNSLFPDDDYEVIHKASDYNWEGIFTSGAHHVGTARMAINEENGVVDRNLKVFGTSNLYICDGSVFPTSGNVNIGLTISALAARLSDHLSQNS